MTNLSIYIAFTAGLLSFFSPCVLPLIPAYILYITGITLRDFSDSSKRAEVRRQTMINSLLFIFGFSFVFVAMGAMVSWVGQLLFLYKDPIRIFGGMMVIILGLHIMGAFKIRFLEFEKRFNLRTKPAGYLGSFMVGITFAAAWVPCVGPILGSILFLASTTETIVSGTLLLTVYSFGLALPFFILSLTINSTLASFQKIAKYMRAITFVSGAFLSMVGVLLLTDYFQVITTYLVSYIMV